MDVGTVRRLTGESTDRAGRRRAARFVDALRDDEGLAPGGVRLDQRLDLAEPRGVGVIADHQAEQRIAELRELFRRHGDRLVAVGLLEAEPLRHARSRQAERGAQHDQSAGATARVHHATPRSWLSAPVRANAGSAASGAAIASAPTNR